MAKLKSNFPYTNKLGDHSVYKMKGIDKLIIRAKGGPSKEMVRHSPVFETLRKNNSEFGAAGLASGNIQKAIFAVKHLADNNISGRLTAIANIIQKLDTSHTRGERSILFTKHPQILEGFSLNKTTLFDSVVINSPACVISRSGLHATVNLQDLIPGINLISPWNFQLYRIIMGFGIVPDIQLGEYGYGPVNPALACFPVKAQTEWASLQNVRPGDQHILQLSPENNFDDSCSLVLSIGIEFGTLITNSLIQPIKNVGCAKILAHI